mgnify:CR=1 FL=1
MKKALIYSRVSTEEQSEEGASIETQISLCQKWAKANNYSIADKFEDRGKSATTMNRPGLQDLLLRIQEDKTIDAVLIQDTDRLARNTLDHLTIRSLLDKQDVALVSINQPQFDNSPEGKLMDTMVASFNAFQSQMTGRKVSKVLEAKARAGYYPFPAPLGYLNAENPKPTGVYDKRIIIPDPEKYLYMKQAFTLYSTGTINGQSLCDKLYEQGLRSKKGGKLQDSMLFVYLKNPIYIGKIAYKGEAFEGKHDPLIDEDTFNRCQEVMAEHNQNASRKRVHNYLLRGYVFCAECGKRLWAEKHKKPSGLVFDFYYCKTHRKGSYVAIDELEKQVEKGFEKVEVTKEYASQLESLAITILNEFRNNSDSDSKSLTNRKTSLEAAVREAEDNWLIHKKISFEQYSAIEKRYNTEIAGIDEKLSEGKKDYQKALKTIQGLMGLAQNIGKAYKSADEQLKRYYLSLFFDGGGFFVKDGKIVKSKLSKDVKALIKEGSVRVRMNWLPLKDAFLNHELEFDHGLDQTKVFFELLGIAPREPIIATM